MLKVKSFSSLCNCQVNLLKVNEPGIYFLLNEKLELVYIGESSNPLLRILNHYFRSYPNGKDKKGIGPVFSHFRIILTNRDKRIRQHYEKRWIKKFSPPINWNGQSEAPYLLTRKELDNFIKVYDNFFKEDMSWHRYINDEVVKQMDKYIVHRKKLRKERYARTGKWLNYYK